MTWLFRQFPLVCYPSQLLESGSAPILPTLWILGREAAGGEASYDVRSLRRQAELRFRGVDFETRTWETEDGGLEGALAVHPLNISRAEDAQAGFPPCICPMAHSSATMASTLGSTSIILSAPLLTSKYCTKPPPGMLSSRPSSTPPWCAHVSSSLLS
jgi:hypothetical protein